jgi:REP element-mobilizing transposase RayT
MGRRGRLNFTNESLFFVTTTVVDFTRVFIKDIYCDLLIKNILHYQRKYRFSILAYVIMPSHFHWIVEVNKQSGTISDIMRDIKKYSAWDIMEEIEKFDKNLVEVFTNAAKSYPSQKRKFWMQRFDDQVIRNEKMFWVKLHYIHNNPVEADLADKPEDYKYSSSRNYMCKDHSVLFVDTECAGIEIK